MREKKMLIIGFGSMGKLHAKYADKLGIEWCWSDFESDAGPSGRFDKHWIVSVPDAVYTHAIIATPAHTHGDLLRRFWESREYTKVLVEKPGVTSSGDLPLIQAPHVSVGLVERLNPSFEALSRHVTPGKVLSVDFVRCSARPVSRIAESSFIDVGMHDIDLLLQLFGDNCIESVTTSRNRNTFCMTANLVEGQIARFIWSNETFHKEREIRVRQTDCNFVCDLIDQTVRRYSLSEDNKNVVESIYVEKASPLLLEMQAFISGKRIDGYASNKKFLELKEEMSE